MRLTGREFPRSLHVHFLSLVFWVVYHCLSLFGHGISCPSLIIPFDIFKLVFLLNLNVGISCETYNRLFVADVKGPIDHVYTTLYSCPLSVKCQLFHPSRISVKIKYIVEVVNVMNIAEISVTGRKVIINQ